MGIEQYENAIENENYENMMFYNGEVYNPENDGDLYGYENAIYGDEDDDDLMDYEYGDEYEL